MTENADHDRWKLTSADGRLLDIEHRPLLCCGDIQVLADAALKGLGVALLPDDMIARNVGKLVQVLPEWSASDGIIHLVFTSRRGMLPAPRAFIDHIAREFPATLRKCREPPAA